MATKFIRVQRFATCGCQTGWHETCERETEPYLAEIEARLEEKYEAESLGEY
jgi:hypothetical protein